MQPNGGKRTTTAAGAAVAAGLSLAMAVASSPGARAQGAETAESRTVSQAAAAPAELVTNGGSENGTTGWNPTPCAAR